jgi:hypothetical protein
MLKSAGYVPKTYGSNPRDRPSDTVSDAVLKRGGGWAQLTRRVVPGASSAVPKSTLSVAAEATGSDSPLSVETPNALAQARRATSTSSGRTRMIFDHAEKRIGTV